MTPPPPPGGSAFIAFSAPKTPRLYSLICWTVFADMVMNIIITDPGLNQSGNWAEGIGVLVFARSREMFPQPRAPGDIIRFHRMLVQSCPHADGMPRLTRKTIAYWQAGCPFCNLQCNPSTLGGLLMCISMLCLRLRARLLDGVHHVFSAR